MSPALLAEIWFGIIAFEIGMYVLLDGADLGIGLLSLFSRREDARAMMMHVIGPIWDANETWLVIAGGTLFGAFPLAYGIILSALYIPVMILIFGLILRAAAFEFHEYSTYKNFWSVLFGIASTLAVLGEGTFFGGLVSGIPVAGGVFAGGAWNWVMPSTLGVVAVIALIHLLIGKLYLMHKRNPTRTLRVAYLLSLVVTGCFLAILVVNTMPYIIPHSVTIYQAASSPYTLTFMLFGIGPLIPIVLAYNLYLYRVFRDEREEGRSQQYG